MKRSLLSILLLFLFISSTQAQEDILRPKGRPDGEGYTYVKRSKTPIDIGFKFGVNLHSFSMTQSWDAYMDHPGTLVYAQGSGISPYLAVLIDWHLNRKIGIQFEIGNEFVNFGNYYTGLSTFYDDFNEEFVLAQEYWDYEIDGSFIDIGILFRYNITEEIALLFGPYFKIPGTFTNKIHLHPLDENLFYSINGFPENEFNNETTLNVNTTIALDIGVSYKFILSKKWSIVPQVSYQFMLNDFTDPMSILDDTQMPFYEALYSEKNSRLNALRIVATLFYSL